METALAVKHADGNMTLQLEVLNVTTEKEGNAVTTVVALKDKVYPSSSTSVTVPGRMPT